LAVLAVAVVLVFVVTFTRAGVVDYSLTKEFVTGKTVATSYITYQSLTKTKCLSKCVKDALTGNSTSAEQNRTSNLLKLLKPTMFLVTSQIYSLLIC